LEPCSILLRNNSIVLTALWPSILQLVRALVEQGMAATTRLFGAGWLTPACTWGVLGILLLFLLGSNGAFPRLLHLLRGRSYYFGIQPSDWRAAPEYLTLDIERAAVIVTTNITKTAYYFGRFDFALNKSVLVEHGLPEFTLDLRTGRPVVSSAQSLHLILSCFPSGIFIGEQSEWRFGGRMDAAAADVLEAYAKPISLPPPWRPVAFTWERPAGPLLPQCASLPRMPAMTAISMQSPSVGQ
jgi:hypothetical protein